MELVHLVCILQSAFASIFGSLRFYEGSGSQLQYIQSKSKPEDPTR